MSAEIISLRERAQATGRPHQVRESAAMKRGIEAIQAAFGPLATIRVDRAHATEIATYLVEKRHMYGSIERLRTLISSYRYSQRCKRGAAELRGMRLWIYVEIRKIKLSNHRMNKAKFQISERVICAYGEGVVIEVMHAIPLKGDPHYRYRIKLDDGAVIDAAEGNCEAVR